MMKSRENNKNRGTIKKIFKYLKAYKWLFLLSLVIAAAVVGLTIYIPVLIGRAIDLAVGKNEVNFGAIFDILIEIGVISVVTALLQWIMNICNNKITFGIVRRMRREAFLKLQTLPLSYLDSHSVGDTLSRVIGDVDQFSDGLLMGFSQFFTGALTIIATLVFMIYINPIIAIIVVVMTPLSLFVAAFIAKSSFKLFKSQAEVRGKETALIDEMIGEHKTVVSHAQEENVIAEFNKINDELGRVSKKALFYSSLTNPSTRFVNNLVYAAVALSGALICIGSGGSALTVGMLASLLNYANQYTKPFNEISGVITELQNSLACVARLFELVDAPAETPDVPDARVLSEADVTGEVKIENVSFSYSADKPLIEDFNLYVKSGQRIAIVGPTGCGKTTLINLLMRFYDVDSGKIEVSGYSTRDITRSSLRASFGMVLQDTWLKSGTIKENISMGKTDATDEEIIEAARAAHAHSFIMRLPDGYNTKIGEDGGVLSQGQKQLLCIARVILALPPMLILDEATSSIDTRTEMKIQRAFASMMQGRTSFIVAHRLSTIKEADVILVMRDGKIVESGNHNELLCRGGFYAELWNSQAVSKLT